MLRERIDRGGHDGSGNRPFARLWICFGDKVLDEIGEKLGKMINQFLIGKGLRTADDPSRSNGPDHLFADKRLLANQEFDQSKWQSMCNEAQAYVAEQAPVIWLFTEPTFYGVSKRLTYQARPDGRVYLNLVLKGVTD